MKRLFFTLLATSLLVACSKDGGSGSGSGNGGGEEPQKKPVELTGGTSQEQTIYADQTEKSEGIQFKTTAPWTATVTEIATKAESDKVEWLTLSAYAGEAGTHTLSLSLQPNTTGESRKAEIKITCGDTTITIIVEQKGTTQSGEKPNQTNFITPDGKITGGELLGRETPEVIEWRISPLDVDFVEDNTIFSTVDYYYQNKTFNITLPTPPAKAQSAFLNGFTATPQSAKFSVASLEAGNLSVSATNIPWTEYRLEGRMMKKGECEALSFIYCTEEAILNGEYSGNSGEEGSAVMTVRADNCKFRKGWNEVAMVLVKDQTSPNGNIELEMLVNQTSEAFKWVCASYSSKVIVSTIETKTTTVHYPDTPQEQESNSELSCRFAYDNQARISEISNLKNTNAKTSITYSDNSVKFTDEVNNQSLPIALNSDGDYASHSLWGGAGNIKYEYDSDKYLRKITFSGADLSIGNTKRKRIEVVEIISLSEIRSYVFVDFNNNGSFEESEVIEEEYTQVWTNHRNYDYSLNSAYFYLTGLQSIGLNRLFSDVSITNMLGKEQFNDHIRGGNIFTRRYRFDQNGLIYDQENDPNHLGIMTDISFSVADPNPDDQITSATLEATVRRLTPQTTGKGEVVASITKEVNFTYRNQW